MSTPVIFILIPFVVAVALFFFRQRTRMVTITAITLCVVLALFAYFQSFGAIWKIGPASIEIRTSLSILGRSFLLANSDKFFLCFIYVSAAIWFGAANIVRVSDRFIPLGLAIIAVLTGALAVDPFLYSAILVEIAVLMTIPLLLQPGKPVGKGVLRFLMFQSIAMPLILFGGWLLGGIQASPSDTGRLLRSVLFLGVGFAFWLAVVPFQSWVPQLTQDIHPYISGFVLSVFPIVTMLIMLDFISGLVWLRESLYLQPVLKLIGIIMVASSGVWAAVEKDGRRLFGYAVLFESGFALIAVSLQSQVSVLTLFISFIPRMGALALMALSLSIFNSAGISLKLDDLQGMIRRYPFASSALFLSFLSVAGSPLLAEFPTRLALLEQLTQIDPAGTVWVLAALVIFIYAAMKVFLSLSKPVFESWERNETIGQIIFLVVGIMVLVFFGILPNIIGSQLDPLVINLPILR